MEVDEEIVVPRDDEIDIPDTLSYIVVIIDELATRDRTSRFPAHRSPTRYSESDRLFSDFANTSWIKAGNA